MKVEFFCPIWGSAHLPLKDFLVRVKESGYEGVEFGFPVDHLFKSEIMKISKELSLQLIAQQYGAAGETFSEYKVDFQKHLEYLSSFNPLFINSQTGKD